MKFIFDEGLGEDLAKALSALHEDVEHIRDHLNQGADDVKVLEFVGANGYILVGRDKNMQYHKAEIEAMRKHKVGAFFLVGKNLSRWQIVRVIIDNWESIKETAERENRPFIYRLYRGGKMERKHV